MDSEYRHVYIMFPGSGSGSKELLKCHLGVIAYLQSTVIRKMIDADDRGSFYRPVVLIMNREHFEHILALARWRYEKLLTVDYYEREFGTSPTLRDQHLQLTSTSDYLGIKWLREFSKAIFVNNVVTEVYANDITHVRVIVMVLPKREASGASGVAHVEPEVAADVVVATVEPKIVDAAGTSRVAHVEPEVVDASVVATVEPKIVDAAGTSRVAHVEQEVVAAGVVATVEPIKEPASRVAHVKQEVAAAGGVATMEPKIEAANASRIAHVEPKMEAAGASKVAHVEQEVDAAGGVATLEPKMEAAGASKVAHVEQEVDDAGVVATLEPKVEAAGASKVAHVEQEVDDAGVVGTLEPKVEAAGVFTIANVDDIAGVFATLEPRIEAASANRTALAGFLARTKKPSHHRNFPSASQIRKMISCKSVESMF